MERELVGLQKDGLFEKYKVLDDIDANKKLFVKESHWLIGGDGWVIFQ